MGKSEVKFLVSKLRSCIFFLLVQKLWFFMCIINYHSFTEESKSGIVKQRFYNTKENHCHPDMLQAVFYIFI